MNPVSKDVNSACARKGSDDEGKAASIFMNTVRLALKAFAFLRRPHPLILCAGQSVLEINLRVTGFLKAP
jgi:hypothetical protein